MVSVKPTTPRLLVWAVQAEKVITSAASGLFKACRTGGRSLRDARPTSGTPAVHREPLPAQQRRSRKEPRLEDRAGGREDTAGARGGMEGVEDAAETQVQSQSQSQPRALAQSQSQTQTQDGAQAGAESQSRKEAQCLGALEFNMCPMLNITYCPTSQADVAAGKTIVVAAYNPLAWEREEYLRVPVVSSEVAVTDSLGQPVESQVIPEPNMNAYLRTYYVHAHAGEDAPDPLLDSGTNATLCAPLTLVFKASLPPLGFSTYYIAEASGPVQHSTLHFSTVLYLTFLYSTVPYTSVPYCTAQYCFYSQMNRTCVQLSLLVAAPDSDVLPLSRDCTLRLLPALLCVPSEEIPL